MLAQIAHAIANRTQRYQPTQRNDEDHSFDKTVLLKRQRCFAHL
jgi:hypothetical protein